MQLTVSRLYHTLRYYRPRQIFYRFLARSTAHRAPKQVRRLCGQRGLEVHGPLDGIAEPVAEGPRLVLNDRGITLRLLNREYYTSFHLEWRVIERQIVSRLGRFHLHYHEFFLPKCGGDVLPAAPQQIWNWISNWIESYSLPSSAYSPDAWHPYVVSRRIPVWVKLFSVYPPEGLLAQRVLDSLSAQARWLRKNLEFDVRGNHLIQNLRGLAVAGAFLAGSEPDEWLRTASKVLFRECQEQILSSGEHFERSPMYHVDVLLALADMRDAFQAAWGGAPDYLDAVIAKMAEFLGKVLHPDGQIPLFGDSTLDLTPSPRQVFARLRMDFPNLEPERAMSYQVGDYWVYREGGNFLIFDAGPVGPDHLPAHAHADLLTFEASWGGKRLVVDAGVYDYEDSPERAYCRGTRAHNTLEINGQNQCDIWSRFRMGRRGWPGGMHCDRVGPFHYAWCTHNAYRHLGCPEVRRLIMCIEKGPWLIADWVMGRSHASLASRFHIPSEWNICSPSENAALLELPPARLIIEPGSASGHTWKHGTANYFPQFGVKESAHELVLEGTTPNVLIWQIRSHDVESAGCVVSDRAASIVHCGHECTVFFFEERN